MRYGPEGKVTSAHIIRKPLKGKNIILNPLGISDCTDEYVEWLNDPEVNHYLETRWEQQDRGTVEAYLREMENSKKSVLFGIFRLRDGKHVGNIKIGPVNWHHLYANVSYFIGDRGAWGKGLATEAVSLVTRFGFECLELNKCKAGVYSGNSGSIRVLEKVGFQQEGCLKDELLGPHGMEDHLLYGLNSKSFLYNHEEKEQV